MADIPEPFATALRQAVEFIFQEVDPGLTRPSALRKRLRSTKGLLIVLATPSLLRDSVAAWLRRDPRTELVMATTRRRFWPALIAFLSLPGTIAFLVPLLLRPTPQHLRVAGLPVLAAGTVLLLWCVRDFYVAGRGTLAPWAPPERLVMVGLYRISRNPMYIAVVLILCGWAIAFASRGLWMYGVPPSPSRFTFESSLARNRGWRVRTKRNGSRYRTHVPRWLGPASLHPRRTNPEAV